MRAAILAFALALIAAPALAQDRVPIPLGSGKGPGPVGPTPPSLVVEPVAMMIATCDADGDGRVSRDEMHRGLAKSFAAIDTGNTGKLGYIAFADWAERWLGDRTALPSPFETDADGDNKITLAELDAKFDAIFARLDKDKDGFLTRAELLTIRADLNRGLREAQERRAVTAAHPYKLVIFDFDGTLSDSGEWFLSILDDLAGRFRFRSVDRDEVETLRRRPTREVIAHLGIPRLEAAADRAARPARFGRSAADIQLFDGVRAMLRRCPTRGSG